jgi:hypothetical protein
MAFSRSIAEKLMIMEDRQPSPPLPNLNSMCKNNRRVEFHFKWPNIFSKNFRFLSFADNERVVCGHIYISLIITIIVVVVVVVVVVNIAT